MSQLALLGGQPVRSSPWPLWPRWDQSTEEILLQVLRSGRWALSGFYQGTDCFERRFALAFARYCGVPFCTPVASGTAAIMTALQGLDVGPGNEVLVPGTTWVACASAIVSIGATPVLVDVDPDTLCMSSEAAQAALSSRTAAILLVHAYCSVADLGAFSAISDKANLSLIEDCSQAHGARWRGRRVGTIGRAGVFSMQQSKVLTSGEGGAVVTADSALADRLEQLRADGRRFLAAPPPLNHMELEEVGDVQGHNRCLSEFQAAILIDRLTVLDDENSQRQRRADQLGALLAEIDGMSAIYRQGDDIERTIYQFTGRLSPEVIAIADVATICRALSAELGFLIEPIDAPLNQNPLYAPLRSPYCRRNAEASVELDPRRFDLPNAVDAHRHCFTFSHHILLGSEDDMHDIAEAFRKVIENLDRLSDVLRILAQVRHLGRPPIARRPSGARGYPSLLGWITPRKR